MAWTHGYVKDLPYTANAFPEMMPFRLAFILAHGGYASPMLDDRPFRVAELGCGFGMTGVMIAAAFPHVEVVATDFQPGPIAQSRRLAADVGLPNLKLTDQTFAELAAEQDAPFDLILGHGIWSWVGPQQRREIVDIFNRRLAPGGIAYLSYNCTAGWSPLVPLREMFLNAVRDAHGPLGDRIPAALARLSELAELERGYFDNNPLAIAQLRRMQKADSRYLAHEFLNDHWHLSTHSQVVTDLSEARLSYLTSATFVRNLEDYWLSPLSKDWLASCSAREIREDFIDALCNKKFRADLFGRGPVPLQGKARMRVLLQQRFALTCDPKNYAQTYSTKVGMRSLNPDRHGVLIKALARGPKTLEELGGMMQLDPLSDLIAINYVWPCPSEESIDTDRVARLNAAIGRSMSDGGSFGSSLTPDLIRPTLPIWWNNTGELKT